MKRSARASCAGSTSGSSIHSRCRWRVRMSAAEGPTPGGPAPAAGAGADADSALAGIHRKIAAIDARRHFVAAGIGVVVLEDFLGAGEEFLRLLGVALECGVGRDGGEI